MNIMLEHIRSEMKTTKDPEVLLEWVDWLMKDTDLQRSWVKALQETNMEFKMEGRKILDERNQAIEVLESVATMDVNISNWSIALGIMQAKSRNVLSQIRSDPDWKR